jgi:hypothetical protein
MFQKLGSSSKNILDYPMSEVVGILLFKYALWPQNF